MVNDVKKIVWAGALTLSLAGMAAWPVVAQEAEGDRKVTKRVMPVYPPLAKQAHLVGTVKLLMTVSPDGKVKSVKTLGGNAVLALAAETAGKLWTFEPSKKETNETVAFKFDGLPTP
jgi:TonB family protein